MGSVMIVDEPTPSSLSSETAQDVSTPSNDVAGDEVSNTIKSVGSNGAYRIWRWTSSILFHQ